MSRSVRVRIAAIVEVVAVFALMHVSYRALKAFTVLGRWEGGTNFLPGVVMILFSLVLMRVHRRTAVEYGLGSDDWRFDFKLGVFWGLAWAIVVGVVVVAGRFAVDPRGGPPVALALIGAAGQLVFTGLLLGMLRRERRWMGLVPMFVALVVLVVVSAAGPILAARAGKSAVGAAATVGWIFFGAGLGEETFFRGYAQSRVDQAFGRRWRWMGARLGPGVVVSAVLFGLIHSMNSVDYFRGRFEFSWSWGVMNFCAGLFVGVMRARRESILPGAVAHGLADVVLYMPVFRG